MTQDLVESLVFVLLEPEALRFAEDEIPFRRGSLLALVEGSSTKTADEVYAQVWRSKAAVTRIIQLRQRYTAESSDASTRELRSKLRKGQDRLSHLFGMRPTTPTASLVREMWTLSNNNEALERMLASDAQRRIRTHKPARKSHTEFISVLPQRSVFVDFLRYSAPPTDDPASVIRSQPTAKYVAFVLAHGRPVERVELGNAAMIETDLENWRTDIKLFRDREGPSAGKLRRALWEAVESHFPRDTTTVVISPDAALSRIPWAALPGPQGCPRLIEQYTILTAANGPELLECVSKPPPQDGGILTVESPGSNEREADRPGRAPVPSATSGTRDATTIPGRGSRSSGLFADIGEYRLGKTLRQLSGHDATTGKVEEELPRAQWAYFAAQGFFAKSEDPGAKSRGLAEEQALTWRRVLARNPMLRSGLTLDDRDLTAGAIARMSLINLDVAFLGACNTGLGAIEDGEGVLGLQRAFHMAGTRNVIATLWEVDPSSTRALITEFHRSLADTRLSKAEALRLVQLKLIRNRVGDASDPYYWAGWIVSGDPRPVRVRRNVDDGCISNRVNAPWYHSWIWTVAVAALVLALFGTIWCLRRSVRRGFSRGV